MAADDYKAHCINFTNGVKNNVLEDSMFSRLLYSTEVFTTNGLYLRNFGKDQLSRIEADILLAYGSPKTKTFSLVEHMSSCTLVKISGVWESATAVGLAFKFSHLF